MSTLLFFRKNRKKKEEPAPKFDHCEFDYLADLQRLNDELNNQRNAKIQSKSVPFDKEISNGPLSSVISTPPDASGKRQTNSSSISSATASSNHNKTPSGSKIPSSARYGRSLTIRLSHFFKIDGAQPCRLIMLNSVKLQ